MISLLLYLLVVCAILSLIWWGFSQINAPYPFHLIVNIILVIIGVVLLLNILGGIPVPHVNIR